jgi:hypothetical protein
MFDQTDGRARQGDAPADPATAEAVELETALALGRAAARTLLELSPESAELFKVFLQREVDRLKTAGGDASEMAVARLRELLRD